MRITIVTPYFAPAWSYGGPPKVLFTFAKELVKKGYSIKVITTDSLDERRNPKMAENLEGITVYRFNTVSNSIAYKQKVFFIPNFVQKAKPILFPADYILFSDLRSLLNWQLYPLVVRNNVPYGIFTFGQIPYDTGLKSWVKRLFDWWWTKDFINKASFRFCQTEHEQDMYQKHFQIVKEKTHFLPLPIEISRNKISQERIVRFQKKYNINKDDFVLLFIGRLHYLKGIDLLLKALTPLFSQYQKLKLLIVGRDDGYLNSLLKLVTDDIKKKVIFTGPLYGNEADCAYLSSDCFVITPRFYEETSMACLEALSFGLPVITTYESQVPYLEEYDAGFSIDNNSDTIQKTILKVMQEIKKKKEIWKKNSRKLIMDHFEAETVTNKFIQIIQKTKN